MRDGETYLAALAGGGMAELTLEPALQRSLEEALAEQDLPFGAAVAISVKDGRVLAVAGRSSVDRTLGPAELALRPWAPAASVFKVVAASALVSHARLGANTRVCYHGGVSAVTAENLIDVPAMDRRCGTLAYAVGKSQNAMIAKLAARHLTPQQLLATATAFGFNERIAFDAPIEPSEIELPRERLEFARAAAGFWHTSLTPLHGALIAAAVANGGEMPAPRLIARGVDRAGQPLVLPGRRSRRVLTPAAAREVGRMMLMTTTVGTAKAVFRDRRGRRVLPVDVAGKTGTLSFRGQPGDPTLPAAPGGYLGYSWFVGYAPANRPRVAFAVVLGNGDPWRIKAAAVARRLVADYLVAARAAERQTNTRGMTALFSTARGQGRRL